VRASGWQFLTLQQQAVFVASQTLSLHILILVFNVDCLEALAIPHVDTVSSSGC